jgi:pyridoxamine 5'-phosphate oxidase
MPAFEGSLRREDLAGDPVEQFASWFAQAAESGEVPLPEAISLATSDADGRPAVRMVLLKGFGPEGFDFYTDYRGAKAADLEANPRAALALWWGPLGRQVRVSGSVSRLASAESDRYFATRPREAQLGAWASRQSSVLENRDELKRRVDEAEGRFEGGDIGRPEHWGGYRVSPEEVEFWQQGEARLHDRFRYRRQDDGWMIERLSP